MCIRQVCISNGFKSAPELYMVGSKGSDPFGAFFRFWDIFEHFLTKLDHCAQNFEFFGQNLTKI